LIFAATIRHGVPALILEAVRRTGSSCCHNGGTGSSLQYIWFIYGIYIWLILSICQKTKLPRTRCVPN